MNVPEATSEKFKEKSRKPAEYCRLSCLGEIGLFFGLQNKKYTKKCLSILKKQCEMFTKIQKRKTPILVILQQK